MHGPWRAKTRQSEAVRQGRRSPEAEPTTITLPASCVFALHPRCNVNQCTTLRDIINSTPVTRTEQYHYACLIIKSSPAVITTSVGSRDHKEKTLSPKEIQLENEPDQFFDFIFHLRHPSQIRTEHYLSITSRCPIWPQKIYVFKLIRYCKPEKFYLK